MQRRLLQELALWKDRPGRKPLVLQGARQVGKTHLLREFGRQCFDNTVYVNLESDQTVAAEFGRELDPLRLVRFLETSASARIVPGKTLIILDEIQSTARALTALKYFREGAPQYHVAAAGSLLGVAINRQDFSFPVGMVESHTLHPLDFEEFLLALGREELIAAIRAAHETREALPPALHEQALDCHRRYLVTGGMPAVVNNHIVTGSLGDSPAIQLGILDDYLADMAKYATAAECVRIRAVYQSIPAQLAKDSRKFQYKEVQRGGTATIFGAAIDWLAFAGIVLKAQKITTAQLPLEVHADLPSFKLYMADTGLLAMKSGLPASILLSSLEVNVPFLGAIAENYVAQELRARGHALYYWESDGLAEIDFVLQSGEEIIPVEVKAGTNTRSRSMSVYRDKFKPRLAVRISRKNYGFDNGIFSVPLYGVFCL